MIDLTSDTAPDDLRDPLRRQKRGDIRSGVGRQLYTATILYADGRLSLQAFHASIARSPAKVVRRLRGRFCDDLIAFADIRVGFQGSAPLVIALVPPSLREMIMKVERVCGTPAVRGFVVNLEQSVEL